jgi:hypothetical protein
LRGGHSPEELGIASPLRSRRAVQELIHKAYGLRMPVRAVGAYLRRWGYTPKRPRRRARPQDPEEVRQWLEETYPGIEARAQEEGAEIHWGDEAGVAADEHPGRGHARQGQAATVEVPDRHIRMNRISTITNTGRVHFMTYRGAMNAALLVVSLGRLRRGTTGKVFLIVDRLRAPMTPAVVDWVAAHRERLELFYLPRDAPERNPDEYLNHDLKGQVNAAGLPDSKEDLRPRIQGLMRKLLHLPQHVRNYFKHPYVLYAMGS